MKERALTRRKDMTTELSQSRALTLTVNEADSLLRRLRRSTFLLNRGIEVYTVPSTEPMVLNDGSKHLAVEVMVRAETDKACGMGVGFVTAISEGLV